MIEQSKEGMTRKGGTNPPPTTPRPPPPLGHNPPSRILPAEVSEAVKECEHIISAAPKSVATGQVYVRTALNTLTTLLLHVSQGATKPVLPEQIAEVVRIVEKGQRDGTEGESWKVKVKFDQAVDVLLAYVKQGVRG